uniref:Metal ABC transporter substrate-binding protein n=1 Tax=Anopheles coluzzii TaxID=1518534 RepID=A0A8W7PZW9_ANOCL
LVMLNDLGWVKLKPGINPLTASERDIAVNVKKLKIVQLEAAQLPRSRNDVDFAVINGNYATSSGIKLTEAVFQEKSYAYVNWGVVRAADAGKPWARDVIAAYNSRAFSDWAKQKYVGYKFPQGWK